MGGGWLGRGGSLRSTPLLISQQTLRMLDEFIGSRPNPQQRPHKSRTGLCLPPTLQFENQHLDGVMWQALLIYGTKSNSNSNGNNLGNLIRISRVAFRKSVEKHLMGRLCDFLIVYSVQQAHVCVCGEGVKGGGGACQHLLSLNVAVVSPSTLL